MFELLRAVNPLSEVSVSTKSSLIEKLRMIAPWPPQGDVVFISTSDGYQNVPLGAVKKDTRRSDTDSGIECTLSKFVDDTKPSGVAGTTEGQDDFQGNLDKPEKWAHKNLMSFNNIKCKMLHLREVLRGSG
ncbi:hypothetical protein DUI87_18655 [Hirundo rustica rustica]|uniref:Uncharacterized protein n=1 Tax=Hirundo rustica rustica TaxID=333673 RepID=A0A3M0JWN1_HIRRU|nr:hypothetical protein DUI87_18655 [Hirundo rustica rustica]